MLQLLQNLGTGETLLADVPAPQSGRGALLIATRRSLVSAGTERMLVDFGRASWIDKARQQPEKVRQVLDKVRTDGLFATLDAVRSKLDQPLAKPEPAALLEGDCHLLHGLVLAEFGDERHQPRLHRVVLGHPAVVGYAVPEGSR